MNAIPTGFERAKLAVDRAAYINASWEYGDSKAVAVTAHVIKRFKQQIARIADAIRTLIANNPELG